MTRTDFTVIVTVEHPPGERPSAAAMQAEITDQLDTLDPAMLRTLYGDKITEPALIGVEVTGWRPWPDNPSDPRSWVGE